MLDSGKQRTPCQALALLQTEMGQSVPLKSIGEHIEYLHVLLSERQAVQSKHKSAMLERGVSSSSSSSKQQ
jgi:hypothetical protein